MNVYQVSIGTKAPQGAFAGGSIGGPVPYGSDRTIQIVTGTMQDAISIARTKLGSHEEMTGIYIVGNDVIVDYSQVTGQNC